MSFFTRLTTPLFARTTRSQTKPTEQITPKQNKQIETNLPKQTIGNLSPLSIHLFSFNSDVLKEQFFFTLKFIEQCEQFIGISIYTLIQEQKNGQELQQIIHQHVQQRYEKHIKTTNND
jgi:hypothetical protein